MKAGFLPIMAWTVKAPSTEARMMLPMSGLFKSCTISSSTKVMAASGVLKAAARPAAAPAAAGRRRRCFGKAERPAHFRSDAAGDMDRRTFPTETHPAANMEQAREKLDQNCAQPNESEILPEGKLELWNAAARRTLIDARHEPAAA